jgi:uncharacterized membrane protein
LDQDLLAYSLQTADPYSFFNITFVSGLLVTIALGAINWLHFNKRWRPSLQEKTIYRSFFEYVAPVLLLLASYFVFFVQIGKYFQSEELAARPGIGFLMRNGTSNSLFLYTEIYVAALMVLYKRKIRSQWLLFPALIGTVILSVFLLGSVLPSSNELMADYYQGKAVVLGAWNVVLRYLILGMMAVLFGMGTKEFDRYSQEPMVRQGWWLLIYATILGAISFEYLNWTSVAGKGEQYQIGLSIIWGLFALALVSYGIWKKQKYIRLAAIVLFIITILKLFLYDLAGSGTITITVSFISLGVILLLVSFLYNRYKEVLFGEEKSEV